MPNDAKPRFASLPDFILGCTRDIWEDRNIHRLHHYYAPDIVVRSPASVVIGNQNVIAATLSTLAEWPDRTLPGEDVIWCGRADAGTLFSSHRLMCQATHTHPGAYGAPSGRTLTYRILADCAVQDEQIYDEWLVRDQGAIVRQLGLDPKAFAAQQIEREGGADACIKPYSEKTDRAGRYLERGNTHWAGTRFAQMLEALKNGGFQTLTTSYEEAAELHHPGHQTRVGPKGAENFWLPLFQTVPNAALSIDHTIGMEEAGRPTRAAVRWHLTGRHDGWGLFGPPTGAPLTILGISHIEYGRSGIHREYTLIDECAIWKQILLHTG
ncbi:MAG: ester cyclase [Pseudomonadota bacterium]